jgi:hypothetical protein
MSKRAEQQKKQKEKNTKRQKRTKEAKSPSFVVFFYVSLQRNFKI